MFDIWKIIDCLLLLRSKKQDMKNFKLITLLLISSCLWGNLWAQNLVVNPSFETISGCPVGPGEFFRATSWNDVNTGADSCSSPDLIAGCAPGFGGVNSPSMLIGYQPSRTGNNHAGIILYEGVALFGCTPLTSNNYREYIEGELTAPLVAGQTYCVTFYINLANDAKWGVNSIGVYFSNGLYQYDFCANNAPAPVTPQLQYAGPPILDTLNWVRLQWNYTATGGETHFVIGNFRNDASTTRADNACGSFHPYAYYFVDDVSVVPGTCSVTCPTLTVSANVSNVSCGSTNNGAVDITVADGTPPYAYVWSNGATSQDLVSLTAGAYTVTVTDDNGCTGTFSATVTSSPGLSISPNPTNISCFGANDGVAAVNVSGAPGPYTYTWSNGATTDILSGLSAGVFDVTVSAGASGSTVDTLYQQNFSAAHGWTLNVSTGTNNTDANFWTVSDAEGGVAVGGCGVALNGNPTLHVTSTFNPTGGAAYNAGGLCLFGLCVTTNRRAESPVFSTVGYNGLTLNFDYISLGDATLDNASVLYNDGSSWQVLNPSIKSPVCGGGQGQWTAFSATLPASCDNNPNVRIAINWTNNDDGFGSDPSFAVDNIRVTSPGTGGSACSGTQSVTITQPSVITASTTVLNASCGASNGVVDLTLSGATPSYTYLWNTGATTQDISGLASGAYTVTVTDANNCSTVTTANVGSSGALDISLSAANVSCGASNGLIILNINNGVAPFSFSWNTGATTQNLSGLTPGAYTVTVTDASSCVTVSTIAVNSSSSTTVTVDTVVNLSCNASNDGSIDLSAISAAINCSSPTLVINEVMYRPDTFDGNSADPTLTGEYIELIGPAGLDISCHVLSDGDWAITIPPGTLLPADGIYTIGHNNSPYALVNGIVYDLDVANCACYTAGTIGNGILILTNGGEYVGLYNSSGTFIDGIIYGAPTAGNTPPNGAITVGGVINTIGLSGCPATINIASTGYATHPGGVAANTSLVRIPDGAGGTWSTQVDGSPNACNASVTPVLDYIWSNGATTEDISGLAAGVYTVTVTDPLACQTILSVTVTEPTALTVTLNVTASSCAGSADGSATVSATGGTAPYSFVWSNGSTDLTVSGLAAGVYSVTTSDANNCQRIETITVTEASAISVTVLTLDIACSSGNIGAVELTVVGGTAPYTFVWSSGQTTEDISGLAAGNYSATVTDANACFATISATVSSTAGLQVIASGTDISCNGANDGCVEVLVNGGTSPYTYLWSNGATLDTICGLAPGTYVVTVTDNGGGSGLDTLYQEGFEGALNWTLNVPTGAADATPNTWFVNDEEGGGILPPGCGVANNGNNSLHISCTGIGCEPPFNILTGALYNATQTSNFRAESPVFSTVGYSGLTLNFNFISLGEGLNDNASVHYNDGSGWQLLNPSIKSPVCGSGQGQWTAFSATLPATCNNNPNVQIGFNWTNNNDNFGTDPSIAVDNIVVTSAGAGSLSCSGIDSITIFEPTALVSNTVNITDANCATLGDIDINVSGAVAPYSFIWSNGATTEDISGLVAGSYSVTITDANGCSIVNQANTVNASGLPILSVGNAINPTCNGYTDGSVEMSVSNGTAPYSFVWNGALTGQNISGLAAGTYNTTVTDALGCTATSSVTLTQPAAIIAAATIVNANCQDTDAAINYAVSGGAGQPYSFIWSNGATSSDISGLSSGTYSVTVSDANGCTLSQTLNVTAPFVPTLAAYIGAPGIVDSSYVLGESINVSAGNDETILGVSYQWFAIPNTGSFANANVFGTDFTADASGQYLIYVVATSATGCTDTDSLSLNVLAADNPRIPNAFSPNNDGVNDFFQVVDLNKDYIKEFKIFNRWGQIVYDDVQGRWDGKFNGTDQPRDAYMYIIVWQLPTDVEPVVNRGNLTLLR
jgi:gliding motility-associated-like protein